MRELMLLRDSQLCVCVCMCDFNFNLNFVPLCVLYSFYVFTRVQ